MIDGSIILPVYGLAEVTRQCLEILLAEPPRTLAREIIVVDDASPDQTAEVLRSYGDRIRVVRHDRNRGFSTACNTGASLARGRFLVFLNNDTLPRTGWLDAIYEYAMTHPSAAIVGSKLLYPDGTIQHAGMAIDGHLHPRHLYLGFPADHPAVNRSRRFPMVTGACLLIARAVFEASGRFDTAFVNGYEDVDLCLRLGALGREVHYCHESVLVHLESVSEGRTARNEANLALFMTRWAPSLKPSDVLYYVEDGLLRFEYGGLSPIRTWVAPELGALEDDERRDRSDRLLAARSRQVFHLLKENITLRLQAGRAPRSA